MRLEELPEKLFNPSDAEIVRCLPGWAYDDRYKLPPALKDPFNRAWHTFRSSGLSPVAFSAVADIPAADVVKHLKKKCWQASLCTTAFTPIFKPGGHAFYDMYSGEAKKWNAIRGGYLYSDCQDPECAGCIAYKERVTRLNAEWEWLPESLEAFLERFGHLSDFLFSPWKFGKYYHGAMHFSSPEECFKAVRGAFWLEPRT